MQKKQNNLQEAAIISIENNSIENNNSDRNISEPSEELFRSSLQAIKDANKLLNDPEIKRNKSRIQPILQSVIIEEQKTKEAKEKLYDEIKRKVSSERNEGKKEKRELSFSSRVSEFNNQQQLNEGKKEKRELSFSSRVSEFNNQQQLNNQTMCKAECGPVKCEVSCKLI